MTYRSKCLLRRQLKLAVIMGTIVAIVILIRAPHQSTIVSSKTNPIGKMIGYEKK